MVGGKWLAVALCPALIAAPALARDGAKSGTVAPATSASIPIDARAMLMAEAHVEGGDAIEAPRLLPALPTRNGTPPGERHLVALVPIADATTAESHALPSIPLPPAAWQITRTPPRKSRIDAAPLERMSLEGSADYRHRRNIGLDARLELRIDGREDSAMVSLVGRLAKVVQTLERR